MKKTLSVILAALMLFCCIPFASAAATHTYETNGTYTNETQLVGGDTYIIPAGVTMTVPSDVTLYLPINTTLKVEEGGTLKVSGSLITKNGSSLIVEGSIIGAGNVTGESKPTAQITFPDLVDAGLNGKIAVYYASSDKDEENPEWEGPVSVSGGTIPATLNEFFFLKVVIIDPDCERYGYGQTTAKYVEESRFDNSLMPVYLNGIKVNYDNGCCRTILSNAGEITFGKYVNDDAFLKTVKIFLPSGEGYEVVGRNGETTSDGTVLLKWGQPFSFRVDIDEAYDMSNYKVYAYVGYGWLNVAGEISGSDKLLDPDNITDGIPAIKPDADGYYHIPGSATKKDVTINVIGVIKNETVTMIGNLIETFRSIFNMLKEFIQSFLAMFNFGG